MIEPEKTPENRAQGLLPPSFDPEYVEGCVKPFLMSSTYVGGKPLLPMIDLTFSKDLAVPPHIWGLLYDGWVPKPEEDGLSVFQQGYEKRGSNNARKKIYYSAVTPDLYEPMYAEKIKAAFAHMFASENAGKPLMHLYYDAYADMYWDLHLGVRGAAIPDEVRQFGTSFNTVIGLWFPTLEVVYEHYMRARKLRTPLREWIDARVQDIIDGKVEAREKTFVHYWLENGKLGDDFRRKDIVFECFHNFLAFSQWGSTLYHIMARLADDGDPTIRSTFTETMRDDAERTDSASLTKLDRFVMELMRVISPNMGSFSSLEVRRGFLGAGYSGILHPHAETSCDPVHWSDPERFDPDRYSNKPTADQNDEARIRAAGLVNCPFGKAEFQVEDGRDAALANSAFGTVYPVIKGQPQPVCDDAGYAAFGFGYRRCAGEFLTLQAIKDFLRTVWNDRIAFVRLSSDGAEKLPVGPGSVVTDDIGFRRS